VVSSGVGHVYLYIGLITFLQVYNVFLDMLVEGSRVTSLGLVKVFARSVSYGLDYLEKLFICRFRGEFLPSRLGLGGGLVRVNSNGGIPRLLFTLQL
jgi:hypothetical protein